MEKRRHEGLHSIPRDGEREDAALFTLRIDFLGHLERIRVGQIHVGRRDGKDEAALPADELQDHVLDLVLDVLRLVPNRHFGDSREVDEGQVQHWHGKRPWLRWECRSSRRREAGLGAHRAGNTRGG